MTMAARCPAPKPHSASAAARNSPRAANSPYVRRTFSRSRSASIKQRWSRPRSSAASRALPSDGWRSSSIRDIPHSLGAFRGEVRERVAASETLLDAGGEGAKIAHALHLVVGDLDAEVMFEPRQQFQRLQTVDLQ